MEIWCRRQFCQTCIGSSRLAMIASIPGLNPPHPLCVKIGFRRTFGSQHLKLNLICFQRSSRLSKFSNGLRNDLFCCGLKEQSSLQMRLSNGCLWQGYYSQISSPILVTFINAMRRITWPLHYADDKVFGYHLFNKWFEIPLPCSREI